MPLVESTLSMQTPASVASGFMPLLVEESGKDTDSLMHTYWFIHMHVDTCTMASMNTFSIYIHQLRDEGWEIEALGHWEARELFLLFVFISPPSD